MAYSCLFECIFELIRRVTQRIVPVQSIVLEIAFGITKQKEAIDTTVEYKVNETSSNHKEGFI